MKSCQYMRLLGVLLTAALNPSFAIGQDPCSMLLQHGIYDHFAQSGASSNHSAAQSEMCRAYTQYESDTRAGKAAASYGLFSGSVSLSDQQIKNIGDSMCQSASNEFDDKKFAELNRSVIDPSAIQAWQACVTQQKDIAVVTNFNDTDEGTTGVTLTFHRSGGGAGGKIKWIKTSKNLDCTGGDLNALINKDTLAAALDLGLEDNTLVCNRAVANEPFQSGLRQVYADDSYVTVSTSAGDITRRLPAILPQPPPNPIPKGTIVAWFSNSGPVPAGWALCDGTGGTPDLRNKFLMGTGAYPEVGKEGGANQQTVAITIDKLYLDTTNSSGINHGFALRMASGNGIINHQTACPNCDLVDSFTKSDTKSASFDNRPAYSEVIYIMKL